MRGSVYKRTGKNGDVRWAWSFTIGTRAAGNRRTHNKGGFPTQKAAQESLTAALAAYGRGDHRPLMKPEATPLGEYLTGWLAGLNLDRHTTRRSYQTVVNAWVIPHKGKVPLRDLSPEDLLELYAKLRESGGRQNKPLSSRSVQLTSTLVNMALRDAVESGKMPYNPADRIPRRQRPKHTPEKRADRYWTPEQAAAFLDATRDARLYPLWALALDSGARRGELSALRWTDVKLDAGVITISKSRTLSGAKVVEGPTKNRKSRDVDLDPRTVRALRAWKARQIQDKLAAGEGWLGDEPGKTGFVFTDEAGEPPRPDLLGRWFIEAQEGLGLPRIVFHAMRHTSATVALDAGVPVTLVSERIGHKKVSVTLDVYGHAIPSRGSTRPAGSGRRSTALRPARERQSYPSPTRKPPGAAAGGLLPCSERVQRPGGS